jgi:hypothetical protein
MTWQDYFDACRDNDIWKAFEALAAVGVLPVVNGEDDKGKLKRPLGKDWPNIPTDKWAEKLAMCLQEGVPVGIGAKPVGHLVLDIDPKDKSRANLADSWKEASQLIFGADDPPRTLIVATENGAHIWFKVDQAFADACESMGKRKFNLPCGGAVEIFVGMPTGGYQVACAPSEGKAISIAEPPISLPKKAAAKILDLFAPKPEKPKPEITVKAQVDNDLAWITDAIDRGYLDSEVEDYDSWLRVGMALHDKFNDVGVELWESWSNRSGKHITNECYAKVRTFKRTGGNVVKFGSLIAIVERNGGPSPNDRPKTTPKEEAEQITISQSAEPADVETILGLMKEREWVWGDSTQNVGWFVQRGLHLVEGKEGTGKTRWLMDLKRRWGLDLTWPDGSAIAMDPDAKMLFVASDSHFDQIAMTAEAYGIDPKSIIFTGPKHDPYNFTSLDDPVTLALIRHWCTKYKVGMVVIDTLMAASSRPLVDPQEVAKIAAPLRDLARELNVAIVLVGHLNSQGETWGRAMGRACDNVIRLEANEMDEQDISIRSVKARWNRFVLPVIKGRQSDSGWEYSTLESEKNDPKAVGGREGAMIAIRDYLAIAGRTSSGDLVAELVERGCAEATVFRTLKFMTGTGELIKITETFPSGKSHPFYDLNPRFGNHDQTPLS